MGQVAAGVAETDAGEHAGEHQGLPRLGVVRFVDRMDQVGADQLDRLQTRDVAVRVGALAEGPLGGIGRRRAPGVGPRGKGLDGVAEDVEAVGGDDGRRQGGQGIGIEDAQLGAQMGAHHAGLGLHLEQVEDGDAGAFACRAEGGRTGDVGFQRPRHRARLADGGVDVGEELRRMGGQQVGRLAGIHHRAAADRDEAVETAFGGERGPRLERAVRRLDLHGVVDDAVDAGGAQGFQHDGQRFQVAHHRVGVDGDAGHGEGAGVVADFPQGPAAELDLRRLHGERGIAVRGGGEVGRQSHGVSFPESVPAAADSTGRVILRPRSVQPGVPRLMMIVLLVVKWSIMLS